MSPPNVTTMSLRRRAAAFLTANLVVHFTLPEVHIALGDTVRNSSAMKHPTNSPIDDQPKTKPKTSTREASSNNPDPTQLKGSGLSASNGQDPSFKEKLDSSKQSKSAAEVRGT